jgi:hypothetical protein
MEAAFINMHQALQSHYISSVNRFQFVFYFIECIYL